MLAGQIQNRVQIDPEKKYHALKQLLYRTALNYLISFGLYFFNSLTNINDKSF